MQYLHDTRQESRPNGVLGPLGGTLSGMPRGTKSLPTDAEKALGSAIYVHMREAGVSQEAIGEALGISQSQVSRIVRMAVEDLQQQLAGWRPYGG